MFVYSFIAGEPIQMLQTPKQWLCAAQLALLPTVLSLFFMTISINLIGSTPAAIMGALEPVTAVIIGVCVFGESFSLQLAIGILAILAGVTQERKGKKVKRRKNPRSKKNSNEDFFSVLAASK